MLIAYRDAIATATLTNFNTPQVEYAADGPLSNIQDRRLAVKAIASSPSYNDLTEVRIDFDFGAEITLGMFALLAHNLVFGAGVTPRFTYEAEFHDAANALVYGFGGWFGPGSSPLPLNNLYSSNNYWIFPANFTNIKSGFFKIMQDGTGQLSPIMIGRMFCSPVWTPVHKTAQRDFNLQVRDDSVLNKSIGQQAYADYRARYRQLTCTIPAMSEVEAIGSETEDLPNLQDISFEIGRAGSVIVIPTQSSEQAIFKMSCYGHFQEAPPVRLLDANREGRIWTTTFDVIEDL